MEGGVEQGVEWREEGGWSESGGWRESGVEGGGRVE